jgi:hypothetical protein
MKRYFCDVCNTEAATGGALQQVKLDIYSGATAAHTVFDKDEVCLSCRVMIEAVSKTWSPEPRSINRSQ